MQRMHWSKKDKLLSRTQLDQMHLSTRSNGVRFWMKEDYHAKFAMILQIIYQQKKLAYFSNQITITFNLTNKGKKVSWCSIMLTQMSIELNRWIEHHTLIIVRLTMLDRNVTTCYLGLMIEIKHQSLIIDEDTLVYSPEPQLVHEKDKKQIPSEQSK